MHLSKTTTHSFDQSSMVAMALLLFQYTEKYWQGCVWLGYLLSKWLLITSLSIYYYHHACVFNVYYGMWFSLMSIFVQEMSFEWSISNWEVCFWWGAFWESVFLGGIWPLKITGYTVGVHSSYRKWVFALVVMSMQEWPVTQSFYWWELCCHCNVHGQTPSVQ